MSDGMPPTLAAMYVILGVLAIIGLYTFLNLACVSVDAHPTGGFCRWISPEYWMGERP